jgi:hypothetical protein
MVSLCIGVRIDNVLIEMLVLCFLCVVIWKAIPVPSESMSSELDRHTEGVGYQL